MDYKKLADDLLSYCHLNCSACEYAGDALECTIKQLASTAITELLARAEAAEERCKELEERCKRLNEARERANEAAAKWEGMYRIPRIRELVETDRDGRCVVLPCKIGTPVYRILWHCGCAAIDDESYQYVSFPVPFTFDMINKFGKSVFLTSEEAEAALKESEEDEG